MNTIVTMFAHCRRLDGAALWNLIDATENPESAWAFLESQWPDAAHAPRHAACVRFQIIRWMIQQVGTVETLSLLARTIARR